MIQSLVVFVLVVVQSSAQDCFPPLVNCNTARVACRGQPSTNTNGRVCTCEKEYIECLGNTDITCIHALAAGNTSPHELCLARHSSLHAPTCNRSICGSPPTPNIVRNSIFTQFANPQDEDRGVGRAHQDDDSGDLDDDHFSQDTGKVIMLTILLFLFAAYCVICCMVTCWQWLDNKQLKKVPKPRKTVKPPYQGEGTLPGNLYAKPSSFVNTGIIPTVINGGNPIAPTPTGYIVDDGDSSQFMSGGSVTSQSRLLTTPPPVILDEDEQSGTIVIVDNPDDMLHEL